MVIGRCVWAIWIALCAALLQCADQDPNGPGSGPAPETMRIAAAELPGWKEQDWARYSDSTSLRRLIDGFADAYLDGGLVRGIRQRMLDSSESKSLECWVMDFGTGARASAMLQTKRRTGGDQTIRVGGRPDSAAFAWRHLSGVGCITAIGQLYFEFILSGYADSLSDMAEAERLMAFYESKAR